MEGGTLRDDGLGGALMSGQQRRDPAVVDVEQLGEIAVGEQSPLLVGLPAQAERLAQQPLGGREALDPELHVLGG